MRIISGEFRGRTIIAPKSFDLRPTTDMAKEGLFNILNNYFDFSETSVLDLFSGLGSISLECASRGSHDIVSVEKNARHAAFIKQTSASLQVRGMKVLTSEVREFLKIANRPFDLIFADPPYDLPWIAKVPDYILESGACTEKTLVIVEHPAEVDFSKHAFFFRESKYGKVHFSFFSKQRPEE